MKKKIIDRIVPCLYLLVAYLVCRFIHFMWMTSLNLIWYFLEVAYLDTGWYLIIIICLHIYVFCFDKDVKHSYDEGSDEKKKSDSFWKNKACRIYVISLCGVLAVISVIVNLTPTNGKDTNIRIEGEKISKLEYKYRIFRDWASNNIVSEDISSENVYTRIISRSESKGLKRGGRMVYNSYIMFKNEDGTVSCYPLEVELFMYMDQRQEESAPSFTITYYKESGVVVAIDGYTVNDLKKQKQYETE